MEKIYMLLLLFLEENLRDRVAFVAIFTGRRKGRYAIQFTLLSTLFPPRSHFALSHHPVPPSSLPFIIISLSPFSLPPLPSIPLFSPPMALSLFSLPFLSPSSSFHSSLHSLQLLYHYSLSPPSLPPLPSIPLFSPSVERCRSYMLYVLYMVCFL